MVTYQLALRKLVFGTDSEALTFVKVQVVLPDTGRQLPNWLPKVGHSTVEETFSL